MRQNTTRIDQMEARPGGRWRYVETDPEGNEFAFRGVYHDVVAPERIVQTFEFEGMPGHVLLETATFEDMGGKTKTVSYTHLDVYKRQRLRSSTHEKFERGTQVTAVVPLL